MPFIQRSVSRKGQYVVLSGAIPSWIMAAWALWYFCMCLSLSLMPDFKLLWARVLSHWLHISFFLKAKFTESCLIQSQTLLRASLASPCLRSISFNPRSYKFSFWHWETVGKCDGKKRGSSSGSTCCASHISDWRAGKCPTWDLNHLSMSQRSFSLDLVISTSMWGVVSVPAVEADCSFRCHLCFNLH